MRVPHGQANRRASSSNEVTNSTAATLPRGELGNGQDSEKHMATSIPHMPRGQGSEQFNISSAARILQVLLAQGVPMRSPTCPSSKAFQGSVEETTVAHIYASGYHVNENVMLQFLAIISASALQCSQ